MMGGAIKAKVEELTAPTKEMKRSSFGIAAAKATVKKGGKYHINMPHFLKNNLTCNEN